MTPPVVVQLRERTLAHVLLDIQRIGPLVWGHQEGTWKAMSDDQRGELLDRLDELQAEARAMIEQLTGVSWDSIQGGCL